MYEGQEGVDGICKCLSIEVVMFAGLVFFRQIFHAWTLVAYNLVSVVSTPYHYVV